MSKRLLLVVPPTLEMGEIARKMRVQNATIPYGVLSMAGYVKAYGRAGTEVEIVDMNVAPYSEMDVPAAYAAAAAVAARTVPAVVGLSLMYNHMYKHAAPLSAALREALPTAVIVAGGCCVMAFLDRMLGDCRCLDALCYAEGELPLLELMDAADPHQLLEHHPAWLTPASQREGKRPSPRFVHDLDEIPPIDFDLVELPLYGVHRTSFRPVKKEREICLPITTTRGCPFNCVFCIAGSLHGKPIRKMSAGRVLADVRRMVERHGANVLSIEDDQFLSDLERSKAILKGLAAFDLSLIADSGFTVRLLDDETAGLLRQAGLQTAVLAIESGSEFVLDELIDKPIKLDQIAPAVESIRRHGMFCHAFLVTGFPGETDAHRRETVEFVKGVGIDWCYITCATPIRGSRLYDECVANHYIDPEDRTDNAFYVSSINTPEYSAEHVSRAAYLMNLELNFVSNYRLRVEDFRAAATYMEHVLGKYPEHAFAHYYAAAAYDGLGEAERAAECRRRYAEIVASSAEWRGYARHFGLSEDGLT